MQAETPENAPPPADPDPTREEAPPENMAEMLRFQSELEFVQALANVHYLRYLAQHGYFQDPAFVNYLKYLEYWRQPEYAQFILYPFALQVLTFLQEPELRARISDPSFAHLLQTKMLQHWIYARHPRVDDAESPPPPLIDEPGSP